MLHNRGFRPGYASALVAAAALLSCRDEDSQASALALTPQESITEKAGSWVKVQVIILIAPGTGPDVADVACHQICCQSQLGLELHTFSNFALTKC